MDYRWQTLGREYIYRNPWCAFRVDEVRLPDGAEISYGVLESGGFVAVVAVTEEGNVLFVRQWRQPVGGVTLELPGGGVEAGEEPAEAARKELSEETGYEAEGLEHLVSVYTSPGRSTEVCHLYRCRAVRAGPGPELQPHPEPTEFMSVVEMPFGEALQRVGTEISASTTVLGLLRAFRYPLGSGEVAT